MANLLKPVDNNYTNVDATAQLNHDLNNAKPWLGKEVTDLTPELQAGAREVRDPLSNGPAKIWANEFLASTAFDPKVDVNDRDLETVVKDADKAVADLNDKYGIGGSKYAPIAVTSTGAAAGVTLIAKLGLLGTAAAQTASAVTGTVYNCTLAYLPSFNTSAILSTLTPATGFSSLIPTAGGLMTATGVGLGVAAAGYAAYQGYQHFNAEPKEKQA